MAALSALGLFGGFHCSRCPSPNSAPVEQTAPNYLISFLQYIPDGRYRRGGRYPQLLLVLVAVLGILSCCRSSRDLQAFAGVLPDQTIR